MTYDSVATRDEILARLHRALSSSRPVFRDRFDRAAQPGTPSAVTGADGDQRSLARLFGAKLSEISGSYEILEDTAEVPRRLVQIIREWSTQEGEETTETTPVAVLSWASRTLPIENLQILLDESGIALLVPEEMHDERTRAQAARAKVGLTSADAAFASTGSLVLASGPGKSRAASLLPLRHLVLVPMSRIYPTFEAWLNTLRRDQAVHAYLRASSQIVFITGPSKSADIELYLTLGVHGPSVVHALIFDDTR